MHHRMREDIHVKQKPCERCHDPKQHDKAPHVGVRNNVHEKIMKDRQHDEVEDLKHNHA